MRSNDEAIEGALRRDELVPAGGTWAGLVFDNPAIGLLPRLTWAFTFEFREVIRSYGSSAVDATIDWVPLPGARWHSMSGVAASAESFAAPIEASIYFFAHHRFDIATVTVLDQDGPLLHVRAALRGDIDGLGIDALDVTAWLTFTGITLALSAPPADESSAMARLAEFTDVRDLSAIKTARSYRFVPRQAP